MNGRDQLLFRLRNSALTQFQIDQIEFALNVVDYCMSDVSGDVEDVHRIFRYTQPVNFDNFPRNPWQSPTSKAEWDDAMKKTIHSEKLGD